jgi:hypothetical protein
MEFSFFMVDLVACMRENRNMCRVLVGNFEGKRILIRLEVSGCYLSEKDYTPRSSVVSHYNGLWW